MPIDPRVPVWAGNAPAINTTVVDIQRVVQQLLADANTIPAGGVSGGQIGSSTITSTNIAAGAITAGAIAAGSIVAGDIAANAVTAGTIAAGAVTAATIAAGAITAGAIAANAVTAGTIAANAVTSATIQAGAIGTAQLGAGVVTTTNIATGAVTASQISVSNLAAVSATMGTVTGGIFQTATSGARVMFGTSMTTPTGVTAGIVGIDGSNNVTFSIDATTGNVVLKGTLQTGSNGLGNIAGVTQNAITQVAGANLVQNWSLDTATPINQFILTNYTSAQDTVTFLTAPGSLKTTVTTGGTASFVTQLNNTTRFSVTAALLYSGSTYFLAAANRVVTPSITWYNSGGSVISTSTGTATQGWASQWVRIFIENITAPVGAVSATLNFSVAGGATSEVHNWDNFIFVQQATAATSMVVAGSITATEIQAGTITGTQIAANTITATNLSVTTLSAISANAGSITAGSIAGVTITGSTITGDTIQTASGSVSKTVLDSTGLYITDSSGSTKQLVINHTNGIQMIGQSSSLSTNSIQWVNSIGATASASIWADAISTGGAMSIFVQNPALLSVSSQLRLSTSSYTGNDATAGLSFIATNQAHTNNHGGWVMRTDGASTFMQVGNGGAPMFSASGALLVTWGGASALSAGVAVSVPGASGSCFGVGTGQQNGIVFPQVLCNNNANGTVTFTALAGGTPTAGTQAWIYYHVWGT